MHEQNIQIQVDNIAECVELLLSYLRDDGITTIELTKSYYWHIDDKEIHNMKVKPKDLDIGDLEHDWERILQIIDDPEYTVPQAFEWLGAIFRSISKHIQP